MAKRIKQEDTYVFFTGSDKVADGESQHNGFNYKTSQTLLDNIVSKKETLPDLFDGVGALTPTSSSRDYVDRKGKRVKLSSFQTKLVIAFAGVLDTQLNKPEIADYIRELPYDISDRQEENGRTKKLPGSVKIVVDYNALTKLVYSSNRVGGKQVDNVREGVKELSEITQITKIKDNKGGTLTIEAPLISLGKSIKYETKNGVVKINKQEITFEDVFVYAITDRYSLAPITFLSLWNSTGVKTELFTMLLVLLQSKRGYKIREAYKTVTEKRIQLNREKQTKENIERQLAALKRKCLTYSESLYSILERIDSKTYLVGKYTNMKRLTKDLTQAKEALLKIGIISDYYETKGTDGGIVCNFVFNERWLKDEANRIKGILPPEEVKKLEGKNSKEEE